MQEVQHAEPAWRSKADFIIAAEVVEEGETITEQLWARRISSNVFELCCIPFHLYNLSLGDIVETNDLYLIDDVRESSGRYVFRIYRQNGSLRGQAIISRVESAGGIFEWSTDSFAAIDAPSKAEAEEIGAFLQHAQNAGEIFFDTGRQ